MRLVLETLAFAAAAVLGTLVFFLHPLSVAVIALAIASIDGGSSMGGQRSEVDPCGQSSRPPTAKLV